MNKVLGILSCFFWLNPVIGQVSPPILQWQKPLGGTNEDFGEDIQHTADGGFITAGACASGDFDGNTTPFHGLKDAFIVKFDAAHELQWRKKLGGSADDVAVQIKQLATGGYIVLGYTGSPNNGDVSGVHGIPVISVPADIWLFKLDNDGNLIWQKCLGGTGIDMPGSLDVTNSGGFIVSGYTTSNDGDVSGNHGEGDVWVVELNATGNILWQKCYGGSAQEGKGFIKTLPGGGYIFTAATNSTNGDVTANNISDIWLVRINALGNIIWQKCYGGSGVEEPCNVIAVPDGYVVGGTTNSNDWSINNHGQSDAWMLKTDLDGTLLWQHAYGGLQADYGYEIIQAADGGFLMAGGGVIFNNCSSGSEEDFWIFKTDKAGNLKWQKTAGGTKPDYATGIAEAPDGSIYATGYELSDDRDVVGHHNSMTPAFNPKNDLWIIILASTGSDMAANVNITCSPAIICTGKPVHFTAHPLNGGTDPVYTWYLNGVEQTTVTGVDTFHIENLVEGDRIYCKMISHLPCMVDQEVYSDTITMHVYPNGKPFGFLPPEITKCVNLYEKIAPSMTFAGYLWNTGVTTPAITIVNPGNYWLQVTDITGCVGKEYTHVSTKSCMHAVYIPTAFTPNNDGRNDIFKPIIDGELLQYHFTIYNRWGQIVFKTSDGNQGWNGSSASFAHDPNVYVWVCTYQLTGEALTTQKGTVTIIR